MKNNFFLSRDISDIVTKEKVISKISEILSQKLLISAECIEKAIYKREKANGTEIIAGIAIPHIILDKKISPHIAVFTLAPSCYDWICLDNSRVKILICLICNKDFSSNTSELKIIKNIFKNIGKDNSIDIISKKNSAKEIVQFLKRLITFN